MHHLQMLDVGLDRVLGTRTTYEDVVLWTVNGQAVINAIGMPATRMGVQLFSKCMNARTFWRDVQQAGRVNVDQGMFMFRVFFVVAHEMSESIKSTDPFDEYCMHEFCKQRRDVFMKQRDMYLKTAFDLHIAFLFFWFYEKYLLIQTDVDGCKRLAGELLKCLQIHKEIALIFEICSRLRKKEFIRLFFSWSEEFRDFKQLVLLRGSSNISARVNRCLPTFTAHLNNGGCNSNARLLIEACALFPWDQIVENAKTDKTVDAALSSMYIYALSKQQQQPSANPSSVLGSSSDFVRPNGRKALDGPGPNGARLFYICGWLVRYIFYDAWP